MANARVYYPVHAVGFQQLGFPYGQNDITGFRAVKGAQSLGQTVNFNLEQVFQLGQASIYENIENIPDVELTVEKVIDGHSLIQHLATPTAVAPSLVGRYNDNRANAIVVYHSLNDDFVSGTPLTYLALSGLYISSIGFTLPVEGNCTESVTLVGNNREWFTDPSGQMFQIPDTFSNVGAPIGSGGVQRRENVLMGSGPSGSIWPREIPGINVSGFNEFLGDGQLAAHLQTVNISVSLNRQDLFELGRRGPYFRYADFPVEVTTSIEITASEFIDGINAFEEEENLTDQEIVIFMSDGTVINLGENNKLQSVNIAGGDAGGGNVTVTYNYSNFNEITVTHPEDPAGL
jgi:hypothetical protein